MKNIDNCTNNEKGQNFIFSYDCSLAIMLNALPICQQKYKSKILFQQKVCDWNRQLFYYDNR